MINFKLASEVSDESDANNLPWEVLFGPKCKPMKIKDLRIQGGAQPRLNSIRVEKRYSPFHGKYVTAASCLHCNALRHDFDVISYRMRYLHSFDSRIIHQLQYYSISLKIDQKLINALMNGFEGCYHVCYNGWKRR